MKNILMSFALVSSLMLLPACGCKKEEVTETVAPVAPVEAPKAPEVAPAVPATEPAPTETPK